MVTELGVPRDAIVHSLDSDERPRLVTGATTLLVLQVPYAEPKHESPLPYTTVPLGVVLTDDRVVTISPRDNDVLRQLRTLPTEEWLPAMRHRLMVNLLEITAAVYLSHLRTMGREIDALEDRLGSSLANREVLELLRYQKSLIYYGTALRACERVVEQLARTSELAFTPQDQADLADALVELQQALDIATVWGHVLGEMMDAFASIISNNLNTVMKFLAAITVVLTPPIAVASFYGMNVTLPGQHWRHAFSATIVVSGILALLVWWLFRRRRWL
jgi:magnesium transporter